MDQDALDAYEQRRKHMKHTSDAAASVLTSNTDGGSYRPKTRETRAAYEALLGMIGGAFGDQPADVLRGAADEVLAVLKNDRSNDPSRKKEVEKLMGPLGDETFARFVAVGKLVTDFVEQGGDADEGNDAPGQRSLIHI